MFRLLRSLILMIVAFVAGMLVERSNTSDTCLAAGGNWDTPICFMTESANE